MKKISPFVGALSMIEALKDSALGNEWWRSDALTDGLPEGIVVDTIMKGFDTGIAETGIMREGVYPWRIVEQYPTREDAVAGHAKWVSLMRETPDTFLKDVGVWEGT